MILGVVAGSLLGAVVDEREMVAVFAVVASLVAVNMLLGPSNPSPELRQPPPPLGPRQACSRVASRL